MTDSRSITFDGGRLAIEDVCAIAARDARTALSADPAFRARIRRGSEFLERLLREDGVIYGVTTGYGDSSRRRSRPSWCPSCRTTCSPTTACGLGRMLGTEETRAVLAARLQSLCAGRARASASSCCEQLARLLGARHAAA